jgi:vitamin B12 transporter
MLAFCSGLFFLFFLSQDAFSSSLPPVVVKAKKVPFTPLSTIRVSRKTLEARQQNDVLNAIKDLPGVYVVQQGGVGRSARVYIRGGKPEHTLALVDGMRANDPSSPESAFDFGHLGIEGVEEIEVLKGPYSAQYGSDAGVGVVRVITARGKGKPKVIGFAELGSFQTYRQQVSAQGEHGNIDFNLNANHIQTEGIHSTPQANRTVLRQWNPDPYNKNALSSRLGTTIGPDWHMSLWNRYQKYRSRYDNMYSSLNPSFQNIGHQSLHRLQFEGDLTSSRWQPTVGVGYMELERRDENDIIPVISKTTYQGDNLKLDWDNQIKISDAYTVHLGAEKEKQNYKSVSTTSPKANVRADEKSYFMGNVIGPHQRVKLEGWTRYHQHSEFGGHPSYRTAAQYHHLETQTKLFTSFGTSIKAPSLFQLFDTKSGNSSLKPEKLKSFEMGIEQQVIPKTVVIGTAFFRTLASQMIVFKPLGNYQYTYQNIGEAEMRGFETFIQWHLKENIRFRADHTYLRAKDLNQNLQLIRRPLHKISATLDVDLSESWEVGLGANHTGKQADYLRFSLNNNRTYMGGVTTVRATTTYHVNKSCDLFGRIENALNRDYEQPSGFMQPGLAVYVGAKIST